MRYLLAGGGTAGHVNPLLALAEAIRQDQPDANIYALGTAEGLEARLVPERGFELLTIEKVPFPRRPNAYAISFCAKFANNILWSCCFGHLACERIFNCSAHLWLISISMNMAN